MKRYTASLKMTTIGEVKNTYEIEWKIHNFTSLSEENSTCYCSPRFSFCNEFCRLEMYPNGHNFASIKHICLLLKKMSSGPPIKIEYSLGLKTRSGQKDLEKHCEHIFNEAEDEHERFIRFLRTRVFKEKADLLPAGVMTVFCSLHLPTSLETSGIHSTENCCLCGDIVNADNLSIHQKKDKALKCEDCSTAMTLKDWCNHECQAEETDCDGSLSEDFKEMMQDGINHDIILKIGDKEIRAHKDVLRARSQVFKCMLEHDMKEKNSGVIDVSDCDPQAMEMFLSYIYSGKVDALHENNVFHLYYIADKYQIIGLKNKCRGFIKQFVSPTNICDVIQLALNHSDSGLHDFATEYFINNALDITQTVEWQSFSKNNFTVANELIIKLCKNKK